MSQIRKNILNDRWSIMANERSKRPYYYKNENQDERCPFCPGNENMTVKEIFRIEGNDGSWDLRVVPNKFPAVKEVNEILEGQMQTFSISEKEGYHEVVIETPNHDKGMHQLSEEQIFNIFNTYKNRFIDLSKLKGISYVQIFKNCGKYGGASIPHSHSQIVALPVIPPRLNDMLTNSEKYFQEKNQCLLCDIINAEINRDIRVIYKNNSFVVYLSFAPRFTYETVIAPINHIEKYSDSDEKVLRDLSDAFLVTMKMLTGTLGEFPYNLLLNTTPYDKRNSHFHWHLEIVPRLMHHAGLELATGIYVNTVSPEEIAKKIKNSC